MTSKTKKADNGSDVPAGTTEVESDSFDLIDPRKHLAPGWPLQPEVTKSTEEELNQGEICFLINLVVDAKQLMLPAIGFGTHKKLIKKLASMLK